MYSSHIHSIRVFNIMFWCQCCFAGRQAGKYKPGIHTFYIIRVINILSSTRTLLLMLDLAKVYNILQSERFYANNVEFAMQCDAECTPEAKRCNAMQCKMHRVALTNMPQMKCICPSIHSVSCLFFHNFLFYLRLWLYTCTYVCMSVTSVEIWNSSRVESR